MPMYDYECTNAECNPKKKSYEFEESRSLANRHDIPYCPVCKKNTWVKKVIKKAFPKSQSWKT